MLPTVPAAQVRAGGQVNVNVYLPDELGARAKAAGLPLSQLLRSAVSARLAILDGERRDREFAQLEAHGWTWRNHDD